jgi:hypothetical protein
MQDPSKPIWFDKPKEKPIKTHMLKPKKFSIFVATPCHSDVSLHYFQACLEFQKQCMKNGVLVCFQVMKSPNEKDITINNGVIEVTHSPTGCMLIKREVIEKMIKAYPEKEIVQKTIINGKMTNRPFFYNLFDTDFDPVEKTYLGEDFAFCKRWRDIGGKCHALVTEKITHVGEHQYRASFWDELSKTS